MLTLQRHGGSLHRGPRRPCRKSWSSVINPDLQTLSAQLLLAVDPKSRREDSAAELLGLVAPVLQSFH